MAFKKLALVVIDEQHRFGVAQRAALFFKSRAADLLVTTATPIPRTMLLALYSDVAVSTLRERLAGRQPVVTRVIACRDRERFYRRLNVELQRGRKGYVILPLIEAIGTLPRPALPARRSAGEQGAFPRHPPGRPVGKSSPEQKQRALKQFAAGNMRLLLATTVIEVGIDVPDATFMVIENADRYGLAQLHQLRGRVGRGTEKSHCFLVASPQPTANGRKRLQTIAANQDGFAIAEMDLELRGGGLIAGLEQAGEIDFKLADPQKGYPPPAGSAGRRPEAPGQQGTAEFIYQGVPGRTGRQDQGHELQLAPSPTSLISFFLLLTSNICRLTSIFQGARTSSAGR